MAEGATLYVLAAEIADQDRLLIAPSRDATGVHALGQGDWSDWIYLTLPTPKGKRSGHVRVKIMVFDAPARRLRLYQTQVHQETGYTRPHALATDLLLTAGPFAEWTESYDRLQGWIDDATQLEIYEMHVHWMSQASRHLLRHYPWDLFMTQVHFLDMAYHLYWGAVDPRHPHYDPAKAELYWDLLGRAHTLADQFIGAILSEVEPDTLVMILGDHGHDLYHTSLMINHLLVREGLLAVYRDRRTGQAHIDWPRTQAYAMSYRIFINTAGRDPQGIVRPSDVAALQERIIQILYSACDPRTGERPVRMAVTREDAAAIGLYGDSMGDVVFAMAPGYQVRGSIQLAADVWAGPRLRQDSVPVYRPAALFSEFSGEHDTSFPFTRAIRSLVFLHGPGVRRGQRQVPVRMVDIAPTLCGYLGIPYPAQCEGNLIQDVFEPSMEINPYAVRGV
jgi:arylsulfatase A-like enzyme